VRNKDFQKETSPELDHEILNRVRFQLKKNKDLVQAQKRRWFLAWSGVSLAGLLAVIIYRKPWKTSETEFPVSQEVSPTDQELIFQEDLEIAELQEDWELIEMMEELEKEET